MKIRILSKILFSLLIFFVSSHAFAAQISASYANNDANASWNDVWSLDGFYVWTYLNPDSSANRTPWKTLRQIEVSRLDSTLFWDFTVNGPIDVNYLGIDGKCGGNHTLSLSGSITSLFWWDFTIDIVNSFTCVSASNYSPINNGAMTVVLKSGRIADKIIGWISGTSLVTNATIDTDIAINGIKKTLGGEHYSNSSNTSSLWAQDIKYITKTNISKQLEILLRGKKWTTTNLAIKDLGILKETEYYNFEGSPAGSVSNETNAWKILEIKNNNSWVNLQENSLKVTGQKTIIVKWWNIYINADIYNADDSKSLLVLIAKRDSTNNKNGWNIYINPNVTNIDAVIIADGSVLNYDNINKTTFTPEQLRRQLLIYGQISSSNITNIWWVPYGSDSYISGNRAYDAKYDIAKLRFFTLRLWAAGTVCTNTAENVPAQYWLPYEYAWAGKKRCYSNDTGVLWLRTSPKTNPVIVNKNPTIITNPPFVLRTAN